MGSLDRHELVAADLCEALPTDALLKPEASVGAVQRALQRWEVVNFPIVADGVCIGLTSRARLEAAMRARGAFLTKDSTTVKILEDTLDFQGFLDEHEEELDVDMMIHELCAPGSASTNLN